MKTRDTMMDKMNQLEIKKDLQHVEYAIEGFNTLEDGGHTYDSSRLDSAEQELLDACNCGNPSEKIMATRIGYGKGYVLGRKHGYTRGVIGGAAATFLGLGIAAIGGVLEKKENREAIKEFTKDKVNEIKRKFKKNKEEVVEVETTDIEEE